MEEGAFDVVIIGTGLTESITAAALSKAGYKVAQLDENSYYGGGEASLSLDELIEWADSKADSSDPHFSSVLRSQNTLPQSRQYSICLCPSIIPSIGPIISSLVSSGVSKYGGFRLLERVGIYHPAGVIKNVPGTKEDVFKSKDMGLIDKRRLMRFLTFSVGDFETQNEFERNHHLPFGEFLKTVFSLKDEVIVAIVYSLACCSSPADPTSPALHRIRRYLRSAGRYGPSSFLVGHYGGAGDVAQGFCRAAAVSGAVYILGRKVTSIRHTNAQYPTTSVQPPPGRYSLTLQDFPDTLTCNIIISSSKYIPLELKGDTNHLSPSTQGNLYTGSSVVRCIAIIDHPIYFPSAEVSGASVEEPDSLDEVTRVLPPTHQIIDTAVLVFPPSTVPGGSTVMAATVLITGEGAMATPKGKWILYITLPLATIPSVLGPASAQEILQPYLDAVLALSMPPDSTHQTHTSNAESTPLITPPQPLFTTFYIQHANLDRRPPALSQTASELEQPRMYLIPPPLSPASPLPDVQDDAATHAETVFWEVVRLLKPKEPYNTNNDASVEPELDTFWPPLDTGNESDNEEW